MSNYLLMKIESKNPRDNFPLNFFYFPFAASANQIKKKNYLEKLL